LLGSNQEVEEKKENKRFEMYRIRIDNQLGTVRYVGRLVQNDGAETEDDWIGIDWDDASRGKHNGTAYGRQYFSASKPTSGSFVRAKAIAPHKPLSVHDALLSKYASHMDKAEIAKELVGVEKIEAKLSRIDMHRHVSLSFEDVSTPGAELGSQLKSVVSLDLSYTLFYKWSDVKALVDQLPTLQVLILNGNRFASVSSDELASLQTSHPLQTLVLNDTGIDVPEALNLVQTMFPHLRELHLVHNNVSQYDAASIEKFAPKLTLLNLSKNQVSQFRGISQLTSLHLGENQISHLPSEEAQKCSHLQVLYLEKNPVTEMENFDVLAQVTSLEELRVDGKRGDILVRIPHLKVLNGSTIRPMERFDAEKAYLKLAMQSAMSSGTPLDLSKWPQFERYAAIHGDPREAGAAAAETDGKTGPQLAKVLLKSMFSDAAPIEKRLPLSLSVAKLKLLCKTLFKLEPSRMQLALRRDPSDPFPTILEDDREDIGFYGLCSTDSTAQIWIEERDPEEQIEAERQKKAEFEQRMKEHQDYVDKTMQAQKMSMSMQQYQ
jgi:hypothetical protein